GVSQALRDLSTTLLVGAGMVRRLRQRVSAHPEIAEEVVAVDEALGEMMVFTRKISQGIRMRRRSGEYTSASRAIAELGTVLPECLPEGVRLTVKSGETKATVVAVARAELVSMV